MNFSTWYLLGLVGFALYVFTKIKGSGDESFAAIKPYLKAKSLTIFIAWLTYTAMVLYWQFNGIDIMGWKAGELNGSVVILGYSATSIFSHVLKSKTATASENP